jgi:hypothetical protein
MAGASGIGKTVIIAAPGLERIADFPPKCSNPAAGNGDAPRMMMRNQTRSFRNLAAWLFRQYCADTGDPVFLRHAGQQADGVAIQPDGPQSHRLDRDEEGA